MAGPGAAGRGTARHGKANQGKAWILFISSHRVKVARRRSAARGRRQSAKEICKQAIRQNCTCLAGFNATTLTY